MIDIRNGQHLRVLAEKRTSDRAGQRRFQRTYVHGHGAFSRTRTSQEAAILAFDVSLELIHELFSKLMACDGLAFGFLTYTALNLFAGG